MRSTPFTVAACLLSAALAPRVHAHATYNLAGYAAGLAGSTNGADGAPANDAATFTNGPLDGYTGSLPVTWYAGMHSPTQERTIQTGVAPTPASGSLLDQVITFNAANDPDFPTDRVLAVGGLSWSDPVENDGQGWGHGLDFGLVHYSPVGDVLANGPVNFTITLADDPSDAATVQLAFAIYGGWDSGSTSVRHQTFTTSPSPVAAAPGETLSRTYELTATYDGHYTVFVAALGGVAGQYQLTVSTEPEPIETLEECMGILGQVITNRDACQDSLGETSAALDAAMAALETATSDADGDGRRDPDDACPDTAADAAIDQGGCSLAQFCGGIAADTRNGQRLCKKADWGNDEPLMKKKEADCAIDKNGRGIADDACVAAS
jgi:hypothetical protein